MADITMRCKHRHTIQEHPACFRSNGAMDYQKASPRVCIMDIETLPMLVYAWGLFDQNIALEQIARDSCMLSWSGKYLNGSELFSDVLTPEEAVNRDVSRLAKSCWNFLSTADVVIGHNFSGFDVKYINMAFLQNDLPPLKYIIVDTLQVARQNFRFSSNKMKFINDQLGITNKIEHSGFRLWRECSEGNPEALKIMEEYNRGDIGATEDLFYKVRSYVRNFNMALYNEIEERQCPICGNTELIAEEKPYYTPAGKWEALRCPNCKSLNRGKTNMFTADKKKSLVINS